MTDINPHDSDDVAIYEKQGFGNRIGFGEKPALLIIDFINGFNDPDQFGGDCGVCEYRYVCGGSRSRAYAVTGDPLAGEPDCVYQPGQVPTVEIGAGAT